jgi:hypothetical protein
MALDNFVAVGAGIGTTPRRLWARRDHSGLNSSVADMSKSVFPLSPT